MQLDNILTDAVLTAVVSLQNTDGTLSIAYTAFQRPVPFDTAIEGLGGSWFIVKSETKHVLVRHDHMKGPVTILLDTGSIDDQGKIQFHYFKEKEKCAAYKSQPNDEIIGIAACQNALVALTTDPRSTRATIVIRLGLRYAKTDQEIELVVTDLSSSTASIQELKDLDKDDRAELKYLRRIDSPEDDDSESHRDSLDFDALAEVGATPVELAQMQLRNAIQSQFKVLEASSTLASEELSFCTSQLKTVVIDLKQSIIQKSDALVEYAKQESLLVTESSKISMHLSAAEACYALITEVNESDAEMVQTIEQLKVDKTAVESKLSSIHEAKAAFQEEYDRLVAKPSARATAIKEEVATKKRRLEETVREKDAFKASNKSFAEEMMHASA
jgi:hypothetical protein